MIIMKNILPINSNPSIITCIHYAYPCAIIESTESAILEVSNYDKSVWDSSIQNTSIDVNGNQLAIHGQFVLQDAYAVITRTFEQEDEIIINVKYMKNNDKTRYVDIFLYENSYEEEITLEDKTFAFRWNPYGAFIKKEMYSFDTKKYTYLKVKRNKNYLYGYISSDGNQWIIIDRINIKKLDQSNIHLGIHVNLGKNYYDVWKKMNFIQMIYNKENEYKGIWLDYYFVPRKNVDNSFSCFMNFLDTHYDLLYDALDCFPTIDDYIHWNIDHLYYVEICLDEMYVKKRSTYQNAHYYHYNLFYGYDDGKRVYYIMGYGASSKPVVSELPYDEFKLNIIKSEKIIRYKYNANDIEMLRFSIKPIILGLYEYINSIDSSEKTANLISGEPVDYGISIIKELATSEIGRYHVQKDKRVSFCLKEHSVLMRERIVYLYQNGFLSDEEYSEIIEYSDKTVEISSVLVGYVIKNSIQKKQDQSIFRYLEELYEYEKKTCSRLLECLNKRDN